MRFFLTLFLLFFSSWVAGQQRDATFKSVASNATPYPPMITFDSSAFNAFTRAFDSFKKKHNAVYLTEILDSVGCTISQLALAAQPIKLNFKPFLKGKDTTAAMLLAIGNLIDENRSLFHTSSKEIILNSIVEDKGYASILFESLNYHRTFRAGGKNKGMIEFVVNKKGEVAVLASTSIRRAVALPDTVKFSSDQLVKSLLYRRFSFEVDGKNVSYLIDNIDVIKVKRICVYEVRDYHDILNDNGELIGRRLQSSQAHLAFEVEIDIGFHKPIARLYFDGVTGAEIGIEYPFLSD